MRDDARVPRRADQLVHPPVARAVLGHRRRSSGASGAEQAFDTLYTALEVVTPGRGAAAAAGHRGDLARPHRRPVGAPHRLAGRVATCRRRRARRRRWTGPARSARSASSLRKAGGLRVRLPLADLTVVVAGRRGPQGLRRDRRRRGQRPHGHPASTSARRSESDFGITQRLTVNARAAGPRLGRDVQQAIKGSKSGDWSVAEDGTVTAGGLALVEGEYTLETVVDAGAQGGSQATAMLPGGGFVVLDTEVTPELAAGGPGPRRRPRRPAGPSRRRPRRHRPHLADRHR